MSKGAAETIAGQNGSNVEGFYEQRSPPEREQEGTILVIQADGKRVPMKRERESEEPRGRLGKAEKRGWWSRLAALVFDGVAQQFCDRPDVIC